MLSTMPMSSESDMQVEGAGVSFELATGNTQ